LTNEIRLSGLGKSIKKVLEQNNQEGYKQEIDRMLQSQTQINIAM
jgi:hypothetical protein